MPGRLTTHRHPRIEPQAAVANKHALSAAEGLRLHWPEYLMEAAESGLYLFSACAAATLLWHPVSPIQRFVASDAVRRLLIDGDGRSHRRNRPLAMGKTVRSGL